MNSLFIIIPVVLLLAIIVFSLFVWAGKTDQFDDIEAPKYRMMDDDDDI